MIKVTFNYNGNSVSRNFAEGTTIADAIKSPAVVAALDIPADADLVASDDYGTVIEDTATVDEHDGNDLELEPRPAAPVVAEEEVPTPVAVAEPAAPVAAPTTITVSASYGTGNTITKTYPVGTTLGLLLGDPSVKGGLGYGANVEGHLDGIPQPASLTLHDGDSIGIFDKACSKAAAKKAGMAPAKVTVTKAAAKPATKVTVTSKEKAPKPAATAVKRKK